MNSISGKMTVPPYLASSDFYSRWLRLRILGESDAEAVGKAVAELGMRPRDLARTRVAGGGKQPPLSLSVPIQGGASVVKRRHADLWNISMHGRWQSIHLGALEAAYSATPYYPHLIPQISSLIRSAGEGDNFYQLSAGLHNVISDFLGIDTLLPELQSGISPRWKDAAPAGDSISEISMLDSLFRYGKRALFTLIAPLALCLLFVLPAEAQSSSVPENPELKVKAYEGYQRFVDEYGDTVRMTYIREIVVYPPLKFKNKKEEEFYWKTVRDVRKTLPYAKLCYSTLCETYEYIQTIPDPKKREAHLKRLEKDIFERYKPVVKSMTKGQGKMLLKLINRETDQSSYHIVKAFLGSFRAGFWQTFGKFFGMNLKSGFNPAKNKEDAIIDRVATLIEQGAL